MRLHPRPPVPPCASGARGGAVVEFALVLTLMISMLAGIVELGRTFWYYDALSKATRNAARLVAVSSKATVASGGVVKARLLVVSAASAAGLPNFSDSNIIVSCLDSSMAAITCTDGTAPAAVKVQITGYSVFAGSYIPFLVGSSKTYTLTLAPATTLPYMPA